MDVWIIVLIATALIAVVVFFIMSKIRSLPTFYATYDFSIKDGASEKEALKAAISAFVHRPPFNILEESDITWLAEKFASLPNPKILGVFMLEMDKAMDANGLKNREKMIALVKDIRHKQKLGDLL